LKILYLAHRIPYPPDKGEKIRCFHQLQFLSARHSIDLFCFADSAKEAEGARALRAFCRRVHVETLLPRTGYLRLVRRLFSGLPASVAYYDSPSMHEAVREAVRTNNYDLIFVYCSSMAQFVPLSAQVPKAIDFVDADSAKWTQYSQYSAFPLSWLYAREGAALARYEKQTAEVMDLSIVTTPQEAVDLGGGGCSSVEVVANGVSAPPALHSQNVPTEIRQLQPYVLFVGTMNYRPNADAVSYFAKEIFPLLRQSHPRLQFLIVGRNPTKKVQKLAQLPGVVVTGGVSDVHGYLSGAAVAVAPFRIAQGVQNKVLEALVAGVPVVLTGRPARAFDSPVADLLSVADTPAAFAIAVRAALENPELRRRSLEAAPDLQRLLSWQRSLSRFEELVEKLAAIPLEAGSGVPSRAQTC
jgi:sugar transferase (PEP-CTERM/EpsH1 system associated)